MDPKSDEFKKHRKLGKRANFLKVYQGGVQALQDSLEIDRTTAEALDSAFYKAFPRIKDYQDWVVEHLTQYGYVENLYGRRYYMNDSKWFYRACNYLIQGTCADMVKVFEINVHKYLKENNLKSKMVLPIHDEIMLLVHKDEEFVIGEVKRIMEDVTDVIKHIPMISEPEVSRTNWAEKEEYVI
jgi:DNA polymerase-1